MKGKIIYVDIYQAKAISIAEQKGNAVVINNKHMYVSLKVWSSIGNDWTGDISGDENWKKKFFLFI